jgi:methyl-accepting chemotaxis protein I, serine sensor receptor
LVKGFRRPVQGTDAVRRHDIATAKQLYERSLQVDQRIFYALVAGMVASALLIAASSVLLVRAIVSPLDQLLGHFDAMAKGDLSAHVAGARRQLAIAA